MKIIIKWNSKKTDVDFDGLYHDEHSHLVLSVHSYFHFPLYSKTKLDGYTYRVIRFCWVSLYFGRQGTWKNIISEAIGTLWVHRAYLTIDDARDEQEDLIDLVRYMRDKGVKLVFEDELYLASGEKK